MLISTALKINSLFRGRQFLELGKASTYSNLKLNEMSNLNKNLRLGPRKTNALE